MNLRCLVARRVVDVSNEDLSHLVSSAEANASSVVAVNDSLELAGAHELLDGLFSKDIGDPYHIASDTDQAADGDFADARHWSAFA